MCNPGGNTRIFRVENVVSEAESAAQQLGCRHLEFSLYLNLGVDDLLLGIIEEIQKTAQLPTKALSPPSANKRWRRVSSTALARSKSSGAALAHLVNRVLKHDKQVK